MGGFSTFHWIIVLIIVLLLFGNRLPSMMRSLGRGVTEFKKGLEGGADDEELKLKKEKQEPSAEKAADKNQELRTRPPHRDEPDKPAAEN
jgi:sec-independent protein translocase protein TatA